MTVYPFEIDSDSDIIRIDDNITEIGGEAINQLRDAVFAIETELGINPSGSMDSLADRIDVSINPDGSIKASALTSVGLAVLPIDNAQVGTNAGIAEYKLALDHSTSNLYTLISSNTVLLNSLNSFASSTRSDLDTHIGGGAILNDGSPGRHVASHIDINNSPSDLRDTAFSWTGLLDKDGALRSASTVAEALLEINNDFTSHQNATAGAHTASAVSIDVDNFETIPLEIDDMQKFVDYIDDFDAVTVREHRATQHANSIPLIARSQGLSLPDGYGWQNVVPPTPVSTYLVRSPNTMPVDDISSGDDVVSFNPDNTGFIFDSQFVGVKVGDIIRINYANGMEASFPVESIKFIPGSIWRVRLNGVNLADSDNALARIDRPLADRDTAGVLAVAAANATPTGSFNSILQSLIVSNPRGAVAVGLGFDPGQLDASHYKLYLEMYPTGDPNDRVIALPFIDVTGDAGTSPGKYTLESVIEATNNKLREIGYNYRMIAFAHNSDFAIMMADAINNASFAIVSGSNATGTLIEGSFTENVIGDAAGDGFDALGLGQNHADVASPSFISSFADSTAALLPTKIIVPRKYRHYIVDGVKRDTFASTWQANSAGYWDGYISARNTVGVFTVETTYAVELDLRAAGLKPGKTIVVQPTVAFTDPLYSDVDYGRFIIKSVSFAICPGDPSLTLITVINGIHGIGNGFSASAVPTLPVKLYFGEDSVGINNQNIIDTSPSAQDYHRLHEVFVSNQGKTFSHERARMPVQAESSSLLETVNWHIENVSPKLRGYRDDLVTFNKYIRFYLLSYNSTTGEYDGYIGQRNPSTSAITNVGPIATGRKNVPTRFYDETNIDYIELQFIEQAIVSPGTSIISTAVPRYVDIELFASLQTDDEVLLLATAEVNWDPQSGQDVIQRVIDRREFGSVDEEDFSNSAKEYISAGDRYLHENGVLRGLSFDFINPSDNREIFFKGGVALVNGQIVNVNNMSVTISQITENPALTDTVTWAICVNSGGALEPIVITPTKQEFFARDLLSPNNTYYIPSVTFTELLTTRKDLTPIYVVIANIASVTITDNDVYDVRRFTTNIGLSQTSLSLAGDDFIGNFSTFESVVNWINNFGSSGAHTVIVKGTINVDSSVDLTTLNYPVRFLGDGGHLNVTSPKGLLVGNDITFERLNFVYNPTGTYLSSDKINSGNGCIYHGVGSNSDGVTIKDCTFTSSTSVRPPFIGVELDNEDLVSNCAITDCSFEDVGSDGYYAAVAFVCLNGGVGSDSALISNVHVHNNVCLQKQGIYVTSTDDAGTLHTPGLGTSNVTIKYNSAGVIGYLISSDINTTLLVAADTGLVRGPGLIISENSAHLIGTVLSDGLYARERVNSNAEVTYGLGNVVISDNIVNWILTINGDVGTNKSYLQIKDNIVRAYDSTYLAALWPSTISRRAINVECFRDEDASACLIDGNIIDGYSLASDSLFTYGIYASSSATITNNTVNGFNTTGIWATQNSVSNNPRNYIIRGNDIYRENRSINFYMFFSGATDTGIAVGNSFDSPTVNGSSTATYFAGNSTSWEIYGNKNQTDTAFLWAGLGVISLGTLTQAIAVGNPSTAASFVTVTAGGGNGSPLVMRRGSADNGSTVNFTWVVPLFGLLPENVTVVSGAITITPQTIPDTLSSVSLRLHGTATTESTTVDLLAAGPTATLTPTGIFRSDPSRFDRFVVDYSISHSPAANVDINISSITIVYRW